jgi:hypothetical protein
MHSSCSLTRTRTSSPLLWRRTRCPKAKCMGMSVIVPRQLSLEMAVSMNWRNSCLTRSVSSVWTKPSNLFQCRKAIGLLCSYAQGLEDAGATPGSDQARRTNTICRAINVCFSTAFFDRFIKLNDIKTRVDHEGGTTYKRFWVDALLTWNWTKRQIWRMLSTFRERIKDLFKIRRKKTWQCRGHMIMTRGILFKLPW